MQNEQAQSGRVGKKRGAGLRTWFPLLGVPKTRPNSSTPCIVRKEVGIDEFCKKFLNHFEYEGEHLQLNNDKARLLSRAADCRGYPSNLVLSRLRRRFQKIRLCTEVASPYLRSNLILWKSESIVFVPSRASISGSEFDVPRSKRHERGTCCFDGCNTYN